MTKDLPSITDLNIAFYRRSLYATPHAADREGALHYDLDSIEGLSNALDRQSTACAMARCLGVYDAEFVLSDGKGRFFDFPENGQRDEEVAEILEGQAPYPKYPEQLIERGGAESRKPSGSSIPDTSLEGLVKEWGSPEDMETYQRLVSGDERANALSKLVLKWAKAENSEAEAIMDEIVGLAEGHPDTKPSDDVRRYLPEVPHILEAAGMVEVAGLNLSPDLKADMDYIVATTEERLRKDARASMERLLPTAPRK